MSILHPVPGQYVSKVRSAFDSSRRSTTTRLKIGVDIIAAFYWKQMERVDIIRGRIEGKSSEDFDVRRRLAAAALDHGNLH